MSHTPGPWNALEHLGQWHVERTGHEELLATLELYQPTAQADAHLMAAAPELLQALERAVASLENALPSGAVGAKNIAQTLAIARAALAKARGES